MTNEATKVTLLGNAGDPVEYTVADDEAIAKGTICYIKSSPQTAAPATTDGQFFAGIASCEKVANDGKVKLALWTHGVFELVSDSAGCTLGQPAKIDTGANLVSTADSDTIATAGEVVGISLQTLTDGQSGCFLINR